jgi:transcriptional regulator with XRE-family HTH domain
MTIGTRETILQRIGVAVREHRLRKNITQRMLAERSGISLTAVKHLERGVGATLGSFVLVCRTLGIDGWIAEIEPRDELSPIAYADALKKAAQKKRRRAHV